MSNVLNFALLLARVWIATVMFVHGWKHVKALRSGPGMANWLESLGLRYGGLQAQLLTWSEVAVAPVLVLGLLTPAAYGVVISLMLVAYATNHRDKGFFVTARPTEGWEYVMTLAVLSLSLAVLGPGEWSLDDALDVSVAFRPDQALLLAAVVGIGGTLGYLAAFWRPRREPSAG
ncbi:MAG: DoxX family protein [Actinobacteria bacterium]|nr:DoxX family protein [Actinomycetota bacterium]